MFKKRFKKKYSLNQRISYHNKKCNSLIEKTIEKDKSSDAVFGLFKRKDFAFSQGYVDGVSGNTQFTSVNKYNGNMKAYEAGVRQGQKHFGNLYDVKF